MISAKLPSVEIRAKDRSSTLANFVSSPPTILKTVKMKFNAGQCYSVIAQNDVGMLLESMGMVGRVDWDGWIGCVVDVVCMLSPVVLTLSPVLSRCLFLPAQVAQGALLRALLHPAQNYVFGVVEGAPGQAQRTCIMYTYGVNVTQHNIVFILLCAISAARCPSARMMRFGLSGASTRVGRARSPRFIARSG